MTDYTPITDEVRDAFMAKNYHLDPEDADAFFDRWLAAHDKEVRADERRNSAPLTLEPDKTYVIEVPAGVTFTDLDKMRERLRQDFPDSRFIVLAGATIARGGEQNA